MKKPTDYSDGALKKMLNSYSCPFGLHEVRMRFLGHLIAPDPGVSPVVAVQGLWAGTLPAVDHIDDLNQLFDLLMGGVWNDLAQRVRVRREPVKLSSPPVGKGLKAVARVAMFRIEELRQFEEGLLGGAEFVDLPQPAVQGMKILGDLVGLLSSVQSTIRSGVPGTADDTKALKNNMAELTKIAETELNSVVAGCLVNLPSRDSSGALH